MNNNKIFKTNIFIMTLFCEIKTMISFPNYKCKQINKLDGPIKQK